MKKIEKTVEKIYKAKSWLVEKLKLDQPFSRMIRKIQEDILPISDERGDIIQVVQILSGY